MFQNVITQSIGAVIWSVSVHPTYVMAMQTVDVMMAVMRTIVYHLMFVCIQLLLFQEIPNSLCLSTYQL